MGWYIILENLFFTYILLEKSYIIKQQETQFSMNISSENFHFLHYNNC